MGGRVNVVDPVGRWAASGAMALSGRADGPPLVSPGDPAGAAARWRDRIVAAGRARGADLASLPGPVLLGERATQLGLHRAGPASCGGGFRTVSTRDGWIGVSLGRESDQALVPALTERDDLPSSDPSSIWRAITEWAGQSTTDAAEDRLALLGLPHASRRADAGARVPERPAVLAGPPGGSRGRCDVPLVVDLTSLWAGPLCAHLLGLVGCRVVKVESARRPDGARNGPAAFFDLLHTGQDSVAVDLECLADREALRALVARSDLVLESSRPAGLARAGLDAVEIVADGTAWLSITARGRDHSAGGYGDDVAVHAGLARVDGGDLLPVGDALADPLTGLAAAAAAAELLLEHHARLLDVSMDAVCREASGPLAPHRVFQDRENWWVESETGRHPVRGPRARRATGVARPLGADTARWL